MVPSKPASRILTILGCLHSVKMFISVKKQSRLSRRFAAPWVVLNIFTATYFLVFRSIASLTLQRKKIVN